MPSNNQHKPLPPEGELKEFLVFYYKMGLNDIKIAAECLNHFDQSVYGLSARSVKRLRKKWDLKSTRQQKHTAESIEAAILEIRERFPTRGYENIRKALRQDYAIHAAKPLIVEYLKATEPDAIASRRGRGFVRKRYWCAGVNDLWCLDQHDKWKRFGLYLHCCVDPFMMYNHWLKVWWTNRNPRLIASYYLEATQRMGGVPLITQSDPGSENFGVANMHTMIRHQLDPSLSTTLQHRWMRKNKNIKSEINWSLFRRDFAPGFENILEDGIIHEWYNVEDTLENLIFRWLAIPWIQAELDGWVRMRNQTAPRRDKNKILPHGIPELIRAHPEQYGSLDFKVIVPPALFNEVGQLYAPADHPVMQLVPTEFEGHVQTAYTALGEPEVSYKSFWFVYCQLLNRFRDTAHAIDVAPILSSYQERMNVASQDGFELLPGLEPLPDRDNNNATSNENRDRSGVANTRPASAMVRYYAEFSDEE